MIRKLAENGVYFLCNSSLEYVVPVTITKSLFVTLNEVEGKYLGSCECIDWKIGWKICLK